MRMSLPRFAIFLAIVLAIWFWPSIFGGKVLLPTDLTWQYPPQTPPAGVTGVHNSLIGDMLFENFAWKTLQRRCIAEGEWPLWDPYSFCGHPLYTTGQASTFYPLNLIFLLVPLPQAYVVYTALHLWLAGVFQYLFLRRIEVSAFGSAVGGIVFALCGFLAMQLIWPMLLGSAIWLPLMLLWIVRLGDCPHFARTEDRSQSQKDSPARRPTKWGLSPFSHIAVGAIIFAMPVLSGFFEIAFYAWFTAGLFTLACCWRLWRERRSARSCLKLCAAALSMAVLAVLLTGPQLLPFLEVKNMTIRAGQADYDRMVSRALRPEHLLEMLVPDIFGNPAKHEAFDLRTRSFQPIEARRGADFYAYGTKNYNENGFYLGLLPLGLMVVGFFVRGRYRWFLIGLLVFSLMLAFGTRIYAVFYHTVPGFEQVRTPFRWMYLATFAICCLAAMGAQRWWERLERLTQDGGRGARREGRGATADAEDPGAKAGGAASGDDQLLSKTTGINPVARQGGKTKRRGPLIEILLLTAIMVVVGLIMLALSVFLTTPQAAHDLAARAIERIPRLSQNAGFRDSWDLAGFMWANAMRFAFFLAGATAILILPSSLRYPSRRKVKIAALVCLVLATIDPLQANGPFMTQADPAWLDRVPPAVEFLRSDSGQFRIGRFGRQMVLHPNLPMLYGLYDTGGYDSVILERYARYVETIEPQRALWSNQIVGFQDPDSLDSPLLPLLNIRYLLADSRTTLDHPDWELVFTEGANVYRTRREHPRAFMVHQVETAGSFEEAIERLDGGRLDTRRSAVVVDPPAGLSVLPAEAPPEPGRVSVARYAHTGVEMTSSSAAAGVVVLCDMMYPGWRAYVDGRPADILEVNGIFRGVCVPAGEHLVSFRFEPVSLRNGLILLCLGLLAMGGCVVASCLPPRKRTPQVSEGA